MATTNTNPSDTSLTDHDGITEWKVVEALNTVSNEVDDAPEWEHWRTSPNYTCMHDEDGTWTLQVGRNDPIVSIAATTDERQVSTIVALDGAESAIEVLLAIGHTPKDVFIELVRQSDEDGVWVFEHDSDDIPSMAGYLMRQDAWGDRVTETPTRNNGCDV